MKRCDEKSSCPVNKLLFFTKKDKETLLSVKKQTNHLLKRHPKPTSAFQQQPAKSPPSAKEIHLILEHQKHALIGSVIFLSAVAYSGVKFPDIVTGAPTLIKILFNTFCCF